MGQQGGLGETRAKHGQILVLKQILNTISKFCGTNSIHYSISLYLWAVNLSFKTNNIP